MGSELKKIDFAKKQFTANGKEYFIEGISYFRWLKYRKLHIALASGTSIDEIYANEKKAFDLLNQKDSKVIEAGIIIYNNMSALRNIADESRVPEVMQMCALFMNTAEEDRSDITEALIKTKVDDWGKEGIDIESFFLFAVNTIPNFPAIYEAIIKSTSLTVPKEESQDQKNTNT